MSGFYRLGVWGRNLAFDRGWKASIRAELPVVSVGNLTTGGTGKTPCVELVVRFLQSLELRVAILSRGYGSEAGRNDEAMVLEENLPDTPHLQGADRVALAQTAFEELESEIVVLDDGFQHRRLKRDFDLVLVDATNPWGHGYLLPRGLLREPISSLKRASAVLMTRCDQATPEVLQTIRDQVKRYAPQAPLAESIHRPACWANASRQTLDLDALQGRPVAGFCGIGNPDAFRQTLTSLGMSIADWRVFPDHHPYLRQDVESLRDWANRQPENAVVVTTQKDLVKLRIDRLGDRELWSLRIQLHLTSGQEALEDAMRRMLREKVTVQRG